MEAEEQWEGSREERCYTSLVGGKKTPRLSGPTLVPAPKKGSVVGRAAG